MVDTPLVTVIAVCFNHEAFLEECLDSIDAQSYTNLELIIADDSSTDQSQERIRKWAEARVPRPKLILHDANRGLCATLNEALTFASGTYVSYISTDDVMEPRKLTEQVAVMQSGSDCVAVVYSDVHVVDEAGVLDPATYGEKHWSFDEPPHGDVFDELLHLNFVPAVSALVRRSALDTVGGYDEELVFEDWDMWLRLAADFEFEYSQYLSARHRVVQSSLYQTRRVAMAESKIRLLQKWVDDPALRSKVIGRIRQEVHYIYSVDRRAAVPELKLLADLQGGVTARARYLLARVGVSYRAEQWVAANLASLRSGLAGARARFAGRTA